MVSFLVIDSDDCNDYAVLDWGKIMDIDKTCALVKEAGGKYVFDDGTYHFTASIISFDFTIDQNDGKSKQAFDDFIQYVKNKLCDWFQLKAKDMFLIEEKAETINAVKQTSCKDMCKNYLDCECLNTKDYDFNASACPGLILRK